MNLHMNSRAYISDIKERDIVIFKDMTVILNNLS